MTTTLDTSTAIRNLRLALTRYERLASPPRHLQLPLVGDLASYRKAHAAAVASGRTERARELGMYIDDELARRARLEQWQGRSPYAWDALVYRLWNARQDAVAAGVLDPTGDAYRAITDRLTDARHEQQVATRRQLERSYN